MSIAEETTMKSTALSGLADVVRPKGPCAPGATDGAGPEAPRSPALARDGIEASKIKTAAEGEDRMLGLWRRKGMMLMALDTVTVASVFMLAYCLRFRWGVMAFRDAVEPPVTQYVQGALLLTIFWVFLIWRDRGYEDGLLSMDTLLSKMRSVLVSGAFALCGLMVISFLYRELLLSRQVYIMTSAMALTIMLLVRVLFRSIDRDLAAQGMVAHRVVMTGLNPQTAAFAARLSRPNSLCRVKGFLRLGSDEAGEDGEEGETFTAGTFKGFPVLGRLEEIEHVEETTPFETLVLPNALKEHGKGFIEVLNFCEARHITLYSLPNSFRIAVDQREVGSFGGIPMILMRDAAVRPAFSLLKRIVDIVAASAVLILGAPFWIAAALAIKLNDGGPVFFTQVRAGLHGVPFRMYKFRSMVTDAEERLADLIDLDALDEPVFKIESDPRVTPIGRLLRRTSMDEIPQLINVLKGEMSLVGPRPEEMAVVDRYSPWQRRRLKAVPGITGHQQIHNRGETDLARRIEYDLIYIKHQGLALDLYILFKTVKVVLFGEGTT